MLSTAIDDYRKHSTSQLLAAIGRADPLALAEAYHRSASAAFACASRFLHTRAEVEAALNAVYLALWQDPPSEVPLEAWIRHRVFIEARAHLREAGQPGSSPSATLLLRDAPIPDEQLDQTERLIASLDDDALRALLLGHDRGIPTKDQRSEGAEKGLRRALFALAEVDDPGDCDISGLADWVLGLLGDDDTEFITSTVASSPQCGEVARALKRGRRRIEGLPPPADLGQRVLARVLTSTTGGAKAQQATERAAPAPAQHQKGEPAPSPPQSAAPPPGSERAAEPADTPESAPSILEGQVEQADGAGSTAPSALDALLWELPSADEKTKPRPSPEGTGAATQRPRSATPSSGEEKGRGIQAFDAPNDQPSALLPQHDDEAPASAGAPSRPAMFSSWGGPGSAEEPDDDILRFAQLGEDEEEEGGRRVLTVVLTVVGALLLLAAGGMAGLLLIRLFFG